MLCDFYADWKHHVLPHSGLHIFAPRLNDFDVLTMDQIDFTVSNRHQLISKILTTLGYNHIYLIGVNVFLSAERPLVNE